MRSIWAVARNTIRQAIRMKIAAAFILLMIIIIPIMGLTMSGDGTIKGRLQSFTTYSLALVSLLLSILTIIVATFSLTDDIKQKRIYTVLTKPIRRIELLMGKFLGVVMLDLIILIPVSAIIYSIILYIPYHYKADPQQKQQLENEFFTARASIIPPKPDVREEVREIYLKLKKNEQLPKGMSYNSIMRNLTYIKQMEKRAVPVGRQIQWDFENVKVSGRGQKIFIRFQYDVAINPPDMNIYGLWAVGDLRQISPITSGPGRTYFIERKDILGITREFEVPADAVAADGYFGVAFLNPPINNTVVIFPSGEEEGLEILYKAGGFTSNYIRAVFMIFAKLFFLAALGTLAATFLSFPVAILLCLSLFCTAILSGFITESLDSPGDNINIFYEYTIMPFIKLIPHFDYYTPSKYLIPARLISIAVIAEIAASMILLKSGIILAFSVLIFKFKEIAKITV